MSQYNILDRKPWLSNYYKHSFWFAERQWGTIDAVYDSYVSRDYKKLRQYKDLETVMLFATSIKFSDPELRVKLLLTPWQDLDTIRSKGLRDRLKLIKKQINNLEE